MFPVVPLQCRKQTTCLMFYPWYNSVPSSKLKATKVGQRPWVLARLQGDMSFLSLFFLKPLFPSVMATSAFLITPIKSVALLSKAWGLTQIGDEFPKSLFEPWAAHTVQMRPESCFSQKCFQCSPVCNTQLLVTDRVKVIGF